MPRPVLSSRELALVVKGLEAQGADVRHVSGSSRIRVEYQGEGQSLALGSTDRQQILGARSKLIRMGLTWPLDPARKAKVKNPRTIVDHAAFRAAIGEPPPTEEITMPGITQKIEKVTPAIAEQWLGTMDHNRKLSGQAVERLAAMMKQGLWVFDGSPIRFNLDGELVDGQHRLWALVEAQFETEFLVLRGVPREAMATMDTGKRRSFVDILVLEDQNLASVHALAAAIQIIYRWEDGSRGAALKSSGASGGTIPNQVLLDFFRANRERLVEVARDSSNLTSKVRGLPGSALALAYWVFEAIDAADAEFFFSRLSDGIGLEAGSPILALRGYISRAIANASGRQKIPADLAVALLIKAWNAYREGNSVQVLTFRRGGASPEAFPMPI